MNAGRLNKRIIIKQPSKTQNEYGEVVSSFSQLCEVWANIINTKQNEKTDNHSRFTEAEYKITIRYRSDITNKMKIEYNDKTLEIVGLINPYEESESLEIYAKDIEQ